MNAGSLPRAEEGAPAPRGGIAGPWSRCWAKLFDLELSAFIGSVGIALLIRLVAPSAADVPVPEDVWMVWRGIVLLPIAVALEAVLYGAFGNTPGKWLLGIKVLSVQGERLQLGKIVRRNFGAFYSGLALGFLPVSLITALNEAGRAKRGEPHRWDLATESRCYAVRHSTLRTWIGAALAISLVVIIEALPLLARYAQTPR